MAQTGPSTIQVYTFSPSHCWLCSDFTCQYLVVGKTSTDKITMDTPQKIDAMSPCRNNTRQSHWIAGTSLYDCIHCEKSQNVKSTFVPTFVMKLYFSTCIISYQSLYNGCSRNWKYFPQQNTQMHETSLVGMSWLIHVTFKIFGNKRVDPSI